MTARQILAMIMMTAALLFGAAELWYTVVPTYGAEPITMGRLWVLISARSLHFVQTAVWSPLWNVGIWPILVAPAWSFFAVLSLVFFVLGRPKTPNR